MWRRVNVSSPLARSRLVRPVDLVIARCRVQSPKSLAALSRLVWKAIITCVPNAATSQKTDLEKVILHPNPDSTPESDAQV